MAVVAPFSSPTAQADEQEAAFQARIHQQFIPNDSPEADLVYLELPADLSSEERARIEAEEAAKAAEAAKTAAASKGAEGASSVGAPPKYTGGGSPAEWMAAAGIPESDWGYVDAIVSRESGWNPNATNASSGACGLVQINPCGKVANGYDPVQNLIWGHGYAASRYGSWAQAYDAWNIQHWW